MTLLCSIKDFLTHLVTAGIKKPKECPEFEQIVVLNTFSLIGFCFAFLAAFINLTQANPLIGWVELAASLLCLANLVYFRISKNIKIASSILLILLMLVIAALIITGGINHTGIVWIFTFVPLAIFIKRKSKGFLWITALIIMIFFLFVLQELKFLRLSYTFLEIRQALSSFVAVSLMIYFYEKSRERNEQQLIQATRESLTQEIQVQTLEKTNRELSSFSHIIAHDLKSPLSGINAIADLLMMSLNPAPDSENFQLIAKIKDNTKKMSSIIDSLLQFSKIGTTEKQLQIVDFNKVVQEVIRLLPIPSHIQLSIQENLPILQFVEVHAYQIFQNLIQNSIKYNDKEAGRIQITCQADNQTYLFSVADNGQGIEEGCREKIFQIFFTTDTCPQGRSNGIGLATVKKIIGLYGGKIWVESEPEKGTTFYFTLHKKQKPA